MSAEISFGSIFWRFIQTCGAARRSDQAATMSVALFSGFIKRYIPEGTSFDDAEYILRSAKIDVGVRGRRNVFNDPHWSTRPDKDDVQAGMVFASEFMSMA